MQTAKSPKQPAKAPAAASGLHRFSAGPGMLAASHHGAACLEYLVRFGG
jgi:hypothetical protein